MKWKILHECKGRMRLHLNKPRMSLAEADQLQDYLVALPGVRTAAVYERTCDVVVVYTQDRPLDGRVLDGEASVNQASLTGEAEPVRKSAGAVVYAGTVVEEGQLVMTVKQQAGNGRYDQIVQMIEASEKLKSSSETRAAALADKLVPYSLLGTAVTYALTRNPTRAISILMVDFSCALKLSMPLAVLSAMRECGSYHITVKGGKYLEALAKADSCSTRPAP